MGSSESKVKMEGVSLDINFEGAQNCFDANHPIAGHITIDSQKAIPTYGLQLKLELVDMSKKFKGKEI